MEAKTSRKTKWGQEDRVEDIVGMPVLPIYNWGFRTEDVETTKWNGWDTILFWRCVLTLKPLRRKAWTMFFVCPHLCPRVLTSLFVINSISSFLKLRNTFMFSEPCFAFFITFYLIWGSSLKYSLKSDNSLMSSPCIRNLVLSLVAQRLTWFYLLIIIYLYIIMSRGNHSMGDLAQTVTCGMPVNGSLCS
jgi:hypothetical protein